MPSKAKPARAILKPRSDFADTLIPITRQPARIWFRVHRLGMSPVFFGNFSHHRFSHPAAPFPTLYVASTIQTCLWEVFGDDIFQGKRAIASSKWNAYGVSHILVPELKVCALNLERTRDAMSVDKASLFAANLAIPQTWALAIQKHAALFQAIKYSSRFLDQPCLALFDRDELQTHLQIKPLGPLNDLDAAVDWLDERHAALI